MYHLRMKLALKLECRILSRFVQTVKRSKSSRKKNLGTSQSDLFAGSSVNPTNSVETANRDSRVTSNPGRWLSTVPFGVAGENTAGSKSQYLSAPYTLKSNEFLECPPREAFRYGLAQ